MSRAVPELGNIFTTPPPRLTHSEGTGPLATGRTSPASSRHKQRLRSSSKPTRPSQRQSRGAWVEGWPLPSSRQWAAEVPSKDVQETRRPRGSQD